MTGSIPVVVEGSYLRITDDVAAAHGITETLKNCRYRVRLEKERATLVHDELLGYTPNSVVRTPRIT
jgi:hypothetical protein